MGLVKYNGNHSIVKRPVIRSTKELRPKYIYGETQTGKQKLGNHLTFQQKKMRVLLRLLAKIEDVAKEDPLEGYLAFKFNGAIESPFAMCLANG